jgi:alkylhydroperoxidase family enzyme
MARLEGISDDEAGFVTSQVFRVAKQRLGEMPDPLRIMAHSKPTMFAAGFFELAWGKATSVDPVLRDLCQLRVASMVGCLF